MAEKTKEYYNQRAPHYADWAHDTGDHEGGTRPDPSWYAEARTVLDALEASRLGGDVLEVACGTGILTEVLAKSAATVTALDSSEGMIERCRSRLGGNPRVRYVLSDFYVWVPRSPMTLWRSPSGYRTSPARNSTVSPRRCRAV